MRRIRIGNDININVSVTRDGAKEDFTGKTVSVFLDSPVRSYPISNFTINENVISFPFLGSIQKDCGDYSVTVKQEWGDNQNISDTCAAFKLVEHSYMAGGSDSYDVYVETIDSNINVSTGSGVDDYEFLSNKPKINDVVLVGNKSLHDIGAQPEGDYALKNEIPDISNLVEKEDGKGLSTNDFTTELKDKLENVKSSAEKLGDLLNVGNWANMAPLKDRLLIQLKGESVWRSIDVVSIAQAIGNEINIPIIRRDDEVEGTDDDVFSSLRTLLEIANRAISKEKDDSTDYALTIGGLLTLLSGFSTKNFTSGILGSGAGLTVDPITRKTRIEADELLIRMKAYFYELVIEKLSHVGGQIILTPARMTCIKVEELTNAYRCYFKATDGEKTITNDFIVGDQAATREFNIKAGTTTGATNHYFWRLVTGIGDDYIDLSKTDCDTNSDAPLAGDDISQLGNRTDAGRMNAIILSSFGTDAPSFKQYAYIDSYSLVDKEVTIISKDGNRLVGDFILTTGINIATQLQILENLIKTEIQSVEYTINANDNYLSNASFTKDMENWQRDSDIEVFANDDPLVTNDEYYADADNIADVMTHDGKLWLRLKNSYVKQLNGNITQPTKAGKFYVSLRYVCTGTGTLTCGFSGQELYRIAPFALNSNPRMFDFSGDWDGTGDFLIQFTGDIYINLVALTNKPLDDFKTEVNTKFQQTSDSLTAIATSINNINRTISESGWLTTADGTEIWAACTFSDGTKAISLFEVTSEGVFMKGSNINLSGIVTFDSFSADFQTAYNQAFSNSQMISKNDIAVQLGFANYADLVANAAQGKAVLVGGYLNLELIDVNTLLANKVISNKVVTALSGKRIEIDPDTNSIRLFDSANAEIGKITFTEEEYSSGINTYPRINLKRTNTENGVSTVNSEINVTPRYIEMSEYDTIYGTLSFNLNAITGLTFTKDNLPTKNYPAS